MSQPQIFYLPQIVELLGLDEAKVKNWTNGRTGLTIVPSIQKSSGKGRGNLYSREDVYLMGIAKEFSKAGFAAKALGRLVEAARPKLDQIDASSAWTIWRLTAAGPFHIERGRGRPDNVALSFTFDVGQVLRSIDRSIEAL